MPETTVETGFVYLARVKGTDLHKIGVSSDPERRMTEFGPPCEILHTVEARAPRAVESELLDCFSEYVTKGEWLHCSEAVAASIPSEMESQKNLDIEASESSTRGRKFFLKETFGTQEIANALDMHVNSIRRNLQQERIRGRKIGNEWVVTESALREWLGDELYEIHFGTEEEA